jgi:lipase chaperone LimK
VILYYVPFLDADPYLNNLQVLLLLNYFISFYIIFHHISQNLLVLREQLSIIENEDVRSMHDAVYKKYIMFK